MALPFYNWSRNAASNATADSTAPWPEGMAPSAVNDSARAMMASTAAFRDDIAGAIVTTGTSTAYAVTSYQIFDSLAHLNGQMIAFTPHATNGATVTLNVDGLGAKPLRSAPSVELTFGTLVLGAPYCAVYNNSDAVFYLHGFYAQPWTTGDVKLTLKTAADTGWVMFADDAIGDASSGAVTRANADTLALFTLIYNGIVDAWAPVYPVGSGTATTRAALGTAATAFAAHARLVLPKTLGRSLAIAGSGSGLTARTLGQTTGAETATLLTAHLPAYTPTGTFSGTVSATATGTGKILNGVALTGAQVALSTAAQGNVADGWSLSVSGTASGSVSMTAQGGTSTAFSTMDPTTFLNAMCKL